MAKKQKSVGELLDWSFAPKDVEQQLRWFRDRLAAGVQHLEWHRRGNYAYYRSKKPNRRNKPPKPTLVKFLRAQVSSVLSDTFTAGGIQTDRFSALRPHILKCCRILDLNAAAVDDLVKLLTKGDVTDEDAVDSQADRAFQELDDAIRHARQQRFEGRETIEKPGIDQYVTIRRVMEWTRLGRDFVRARSSEWGEPEQPGSGNVGHKWKWSRIRPILVKQLNERRLVDIAEKLLQ